MKHIVLAMALSGTAAGWWILWGGQAYLAATEPRPSASSAPSPLRTKEPERLVPRPLDVRPTPLREGIAATINEARPRPQAGLSVALKGIRPDRGPIRLALFDTADGFPRPQRALRIVSVTPDKTHQTVTLGNLPRGRYAVAAFQDLNEDGTLNKGAFGIPSEPYGFSRSARGSFGPPTFAAAAVDVGEKPVSVEVLLR